MVANHPNRSLLRIRSQAKWVQEVDLGGGGLGLEVRLGIATCGTVPICGYADMPPLWAAA